MSINSHLTCTLMICTSTYYCVLSSWRVMEKVFLNAYEVFQPILGLNDLDLNAIDIYLTSNICLIHAANVIIARFLA